MCYGGNALARVLNESSGKEGARQESAKGQTLSHHGFFYGEANTPVTELAIFSNQIILSWGETSKEN